MNASPHMQLPRLNFSDDRRRQKWMSEQRTAGRRPTAHPVSQELSALHLVGHSKTLALQQRVNLVDEFLPELVISLGLQPHLDVAPLPLTLGRAEHVECDRIPVVERLLGACSPFFGTARVPQVLHAHRRVAGLVSSNEYASPLQGRVA